MKRSFTFAVGVGIFMAASALGVSDNNSTLVAAPSDAENFGLIQVETLTHEQRALLQAKYRYWSASSQTSASLPR